MTNSQHTRPRAHPSTATALFSEGEFCVVVFDNRARTIHRLNPSASAVWLMCEGQATVDAIAEELGDILGFDKDSTAEVQAAVSSFWNSGLLAGSPVAATTVPTTETGPTVSVLPRPPDP